MFILNRRRRLDQTIITIQKKIFYTYNNFYILAKNIYRLTVTRFSLMQYKGWFF